MLFERMPLLYVCMSVRKGRYSVGRSAGNRQRIDGMLSTVLM